MISKYFNYIELKIWMKNVKTHLTTYYERKTKKFGKYK
jgi:hypothetical protein